MRAFNATALVVLLHACATVDPYAVTGELLHTTAREFVSVGTAMNQGYDTKSISDTQYAEWAVFATHFKEAFAAASIAYDLAVQLQDPAKRSDVQSVLITLGAELAKFTPLVVEIMGGVQ